MPAGYIEPRKILFYTCEMPHETCGMFFGREIEQTITARDIEATAEQIGRIRARRRLTYPRLESPAPQLTGLDTYAVR